MFSFIRKKPADWQAPPASPGPPASAPPAGGPASVAASADRPRSALEWLNTDIGELLFGKKESGPTPSAADRERVGDAAVAPADIAAPSPADLLPPLPGGEPVEDRRDWLARLKTGLRRTGSSIAEAFVGASIDDAMYEDLEAALLQADAGAAATRYLLDDLQGRVTRADVRDVAAVRRLLADCVAELLAPLEAPLVVGAHVPTVIMVVGVNGAGKTTSIGKLARYLMDAQQKVLLAAADTFRAAAREQLLAWAERADSGTDAAAGAPRASGRQRIEIVSQEGGDPAGVTFDAVVAGKARGCDVVIVDTAGRLATQAHLMEELKKIRRAIGKAQAGAPHEVLLVIDGNTGQNALAQVQAFDAALQLTGLVITKLDGTAKGGVLAAIALWARSRPQPVPVYFVGVGETLADLQTFRAREFAQALVGPDS
jgi:fused signal recognition particle receptor